METTNADIYSVWVIDWKNVMHIYKFTNGEDYQKFVDYCTVNEQNWGGEEAPIQREYNIEESKKWLEDVLKEDSD